MTIKIKIYSQNPNRKKFIYDQHFGASCFILLYFEVVPALSILRTAVNWFSAFSMPLFFIYLNKIRLHSDANKLINDKKIKQRQKTFLLYFINFIAVS